MRIFLRCSASLLLMFSACTEDNPVSVTTLPTSPEGFIFSGKVGTAYIFEGQLTRRDTLGKDSVLYRRRLSIILRNRNALLSNGKTAVEYTVVDSLYFPRTQVTSTQQYIWATMQELRTGISANDTVGSSVLTFPMTVGRTFPRWENDTDTSRYTRIVAVGETVTVPVGRFETVRTQQTGIEKAGSTQTQWTSDVFCAAGVLLVKSQGIYTIKQASSKEIVDTYNQELVEIRQP